MSSRRRPPCVLRPAGPVGLVRAVAHHLDERSRSTAAPRSPVQGGRSCGYTVGMSTRPAGGLSAAEVLRVLAAVEAVGLQAWVAGGWGVDALVGRQTRPHRDLDLALDVTRAGVERALSALEPLGYHVETDWRPCRVELAAPSARWVDLHPVTFDDRGTGWQADVDGLPPFRYPPDAFSSGTIDGRAVRCLSVVQQLRFHEGYPPRPQDLADVALLRRLRGSTR